MFRVVGIISYVCNDLLFKGRYGSFEGQLVKVITVALTAKSAAKTY